MMSWFTILTFFTGFAVSVICLPMDIEIATAPPLSATNLTSKNEEGSVQRTKLMQLGNGSTPSNNSVLQHSLSGKTLGKIISTTLFVIDVIEVKNQTSDDLIDALYDDVIKEVPAWITGPLPLFILVINDDDRSVEITLDEISNKLQEEGFAVDKVIDDGQIKLIKLLDLIEATEEIPIESKTGSRTLEPDTKIHKFDYSSSSREKRSVCLNCTIVIKNNPNRGRRGGHKGGCRGGCGHGGDRPQQARPVYLQPVYQTVYRYPQQHDPQPVYQNPQQNYPQPVSQNLQQHYPQPVAQNLQQQYPQPVSQNLQQQYPQPVSQNPQQYHTQPQKCDTCGEGQTNGGGNAYAQATAQASASSSSRGYGR